MRNITTLLLVLFSIHCFSQNAVYPNISGGGGSVSRSYTDTILFNVAAQTIQNLVPSGNMNITTKKSYNTVNNSTAIIHIAPTSYTLKIDTSKYDVYGILDNTRDNVLFLQNVDTTIKTIAKIYQPALSPYVASPTGPFSYQTQNNLAGSITLNNANGGLSFASDHVYTFSCWLKLNQTGINHNIFTKGDGSNRSIEFSVSSNNKISIGNLTTAGGYIYITGSTVLTVNTWYYVTATYSGSATTGGFTLYVNGVAETPTPLTSSYTSLNPNGSIYIGYNPDLVSYGDFKIENFWAANIQCTGTQVTEAYNSGTTKDPATFSFYSNIIALYYFNQNLNDVLTNHNGTSSSPTYSTDYK